MALAGADLGMWDWDVQTGVATYDERWGAMLGLAPHEIGHTFQFWEGLLHPDDKASALKAADDHLKGRTPRYESEHRLRHTSGSWVWVLARGSVIERDARGLPLRACGTHLDITARKTAEAERMRDEARFRSLASILQYRGQTTQDFLDFALKEAIELTESRLGYVYFYDEDLRRFVLNTWSAAVTAECAVKEPPAQYDLDGTGIWGEAVRQRRAIIINDFSAPNPLKKGYPEGHVALDRFLTVPVFSNGRIVATAGVANRIGLYDETDARQLSLLMEAVWKVVEQRQAQEALAESENLLRTLVATAPEAIVVQTEGKFSFLNPAALRLFGAERADQLIGTRFSDRVHPDYRDLVETRIEVLNRHQQHVPPLDEIYVRLDGSTVNVHVSVVPFTYKGMNGALAFLRDITGRKRAEEALRRSEEMHRALLEGLPDTVVRFDRNGRHLFVSRPSLEIPEKDPARYLGRTHEEMGFPAASCRLWRDAIAAVFRTGELQEIERSVATPRGPRIINTRLIPELDTRHTVSSVLSISRDVTEHRKAERDYQTLFREMLDGFALHEIICDTDGRPIDYRYLAVNPAFEKHTGLKASDVIGRTAREVLPGIEQVWIDRYGRVALTGSQDSFTDWAADLSKCFEVTAFRYGPRQFAVIFADVTERRKAEEEREKLREQLAQSQKMESIGRLAGGVAHDFNNMLSVILGQVGIALEGLSPEGPLAESLGEIQRAAQRSADLTRQLLAFARKQAVTPRVLDLNATVRSTLSMLKRLIGEDIDLSWVPGTDLWPVRIDPGQIDQVLANLCVNSRDAITGHGRVTIETSNVTLDADYCQAHPGAEPGDFALLAVSDDGCGMTPEVMEHLFEPFFTSKGIGKGTGLGLATVYGIVKQNGGSICPYSEPGRGSTFRVYIPRHRGESQPVPAGEAAAGAARNRGGTETILLVEDEAAILKIGIRMLSGLGYAVIGAGSPADALRQASGHEGGIDLLITDVVMPEMNGPELSRKLRERYPELRVVFMSGYTANVMADHGIIDEGTSFLSKPFSLGQLAAKVRESLDHPA